MVNVFEIQSVGAALAFIAWTFVVIAFAKAAFGSFIAAETTWWLHRRNNEQRQALQRLNWEIQNRAKWNPDVAANSPHAAREPLSDAELEERRARLPALMRGRLGHRAFQWFVGCFACQTFWSALLVYAVMHGVTDPRAWIASALAYSGFAVAIVAWLGQLPVTPAAPQAKPGGGCKSCGK